MGKTSHKIKIYIICILVFFASVAVALFLPISEVIKDVALIPGLGSLFLLIVQLWKDERAHDRAIELQNKQQDFILGTASHMADVVYDKHVAFCEAYIGRVQNALMEMLRDGPSEKTMNIGSELVRIRKQHSTWLTTEIEEKLNPFEMELINIGAEMHRLRLEDKFTGEERKEIVDRVFKSFGLVVGHGHALDEKEVSVKIDTVIEEIRKILGINLLIELRNKITRLAIERIESHYSK
ncbi:MAG: hypothetical protein PHQ47_01355 [Candidatus Portnoybacteria bacterium]|nr:hypothetical protein [Candidatus Portnoybacteria bacterium]